MIFQQLTILMPYIVLSAASILVLLMVFLFPKKEFASVFSGASILSLAVALAYIINMPATEPNAWGLANDSLGKIFSVIILLLTAIAIPCLISKKGNVYEKPSAISSLVLLSAMGGLLMACASDLLVAFVGLELLSIPLYILAALGNDKKKCSEAAFKYFLLGALSSALFAYGIALVWGTTKSMDIIGIGEFLRSGADISMYTFVGIGLLFTGMAFKLGFAPFHFWLLDVYQGAPAPVVGWMSGIVKAACFAFLLRLMAHVQPLMPVQWTQVLLFMSIISMIVGSFGALRQHDVKRMLAYSTVAHVGYLMLALLSLNDGLQQVTVQAVAFYVLIYGLASLASFVALMPEEALGSTRITSLSGLLKRQPLVAITLGISLLSLAGMPPLGGFLGKFQVFQIAVDKGYIVPAIIALLTSVVSLGYYLRLLIPSFMEPNHHETYVQTTFGTYTMMYVAMLFIVILGVYPTAVFDLIKLVSP